MFRTLHKFSLFDFLAQEFSKSFYPAKFDNYVQSWYWINTKFNAFCNRLNN